MIDIYPWQKSLWQQVISQHLSGRLPHALLLTGASGLGKKQFAKSLSQFIFCENKKEGVSCGKCRSCQLYLSDNHPDLIILGPDEQQKPIKVDLVRDVIHRVQQTALRSAYQVVIINDADKLNRNAANALLKTLEEPTGQVAFLIETSKPYKLPKTIISRCQQLVFQLPSIEDSIVWLRDQGVGDQAELFLSLAQQSPLTAYEFTQNNKVEIRNAIYTHFFDYMSENISLIKAAEDINKSIDSMSECIHWLLILANDLLAAKSGLNDYLINKDHQASILAVISQSSITHIPHVLMNAARKIASGIQLNQQLFIENLLYQCKSEEEKVYVS